MSTKGGATTTDRLARGGEPGVAPDPPSDSATSRARTPELVSVAPSVALPGDRISIAGRGFSSDTTVVFGADPRTGGGGVEGSDLVLAGATMLEVTVPAVASGEVTVMVRDSATEQAAVLVGAFTVQAVPGGSGRGRLPHGGSLPGSPRPVDLAAWGDPAPRPDRRAGSPGAGEASSGLTGFRTARYAGLESGPTIVRSEEWNPERLRDHWTRRRPAGAAGDERGDRREGRHDRGLDPRPHGDPGATHRRLDGRPGRGRGDARRSSPLGCGAARRRSPDPLHHDAGPDRPGDVVHGPGKSSGLQCGAFDVNAACSGFVYGLVAANGFLAQGLERVLLVGVRDSQPYHGLGRPLDLHPVRGRCGCHRGRGRERGRRGCSDGDLDADGSLQPLLYCDVGQTFQMRGRRGLQERRPRDGRVLAQGARARGRRAGRRHLARPAPGEPAHRRDRVRASRDSDGAHHARARGDGGNASAASIPLALSLRAARHGTDRVGRPGAPVRFRRRHDGGERPSCAGSQRP